MDWSKNFSIDFRNADENANIQPLYYETKLRIREKPNLLHNRYLVGETKGYGDISEIFEIMDMNTLERKVAKVYRMQKLLRSSWNENLLRFLKLELKVAPKLNHKNIVKYFEVTEGDIEQLPNAYLIMEYCTTSIDILINSSPEKKLPVYQCHEYFIDLIDGLEYLHSIGIIHRDIKPQNLVLTNANVLKICDFGICEELETYEKLNKSVHQHGTTPYMAPEIFISCDTENEELFLDGCKIDIWSAGVTLYYMITGDLPFNYNYIGASCISDEFKVKDELTNNPFLHDFITKILDKKPTQRIDIDGIRQHPWFNQQIPEKLVKISTITKDEYDSFSMTSSLHQLYYPFTDEQNIITVPDEKIDQFRQIKRIPIIQSNRITKKREPYKRFNFRTLLYRAIRKFILFIR
ncbi:polarization-related protein LKB1-like protein [Leptotrombidium deliense]|uniref:Polarization-related protein LKB1-like protein n=1 Tax=Leptotrombidium deliense TaxID=299467 RepID=A0A443S1W7_9ACAR|nr:polarization-related protein LKB1-like protein [Leptotrombidium deliense]